jgi:NAD(P)-dependent dehydrogenase (short-subunit alcohol dehydrogenase family)
MTEKVAVITGASSGIGRAACLRFAREGATVVAAARNKDDLYALRSDAGEAGVRIRPAVTDVTDTSQVDSLASEIFELEGRVDVLVNAAGIIKNGSIENTTLDEWDTMLDVNLRSVFYLMQKFVPLLQETKGNIVNVSSVTGVRAFPGVLAYCVSKAGVDQLTRCAALELAPKGIRVNAVNPGVVVTNLHRRGGMAEKDYEKFLEHAKSTHPIGRAGRPEEVADLIYFLASDNAGWITGATYEIDGGRAQTCAR